MILLLSFTQFMHWTAFSFGQSEMDSLFLKPVSSALWVCQWRFGGSWNQALPLPDLGVSLASRVLLLLRHRCGHCLLPLWLCCLPSSPEESSKARNGWVHMVQSRKALDAWQTWVQSAPGWGGCAAHLSSFSRGSPTVSYHRKGGCQLFLLGRFRPVKVEVLSHNG